MAIEDDLSLAGVPYPLAVEILNSVKSGATTTPERLAAFGVAGPTAITLAAQINSRNSSARALIASGFAPQAAHVIKAAITSGAGGGVVLDYPVMFIGGASLEQLGQTGEDATYRFGNSPNGPLNWANDLGAARIFDIRSKYLLGTAPYFDTPSNFASAGAGFGIGGTRNTSIEAQVPILISAMQAVPVGKRALFFSAGRNNLSDGMLASEYLSRFATELDKLLPVADLVIVPGLWLRDTSVGGVWASGGSARAALLAINDGLAALCATRGTKCLFVPLIDAVCEATGDRNPKAGYTHTDGTHYVPPGAQATGKAIRAAILSRFVPQTFPAGLGIAPSLLTTGGTLTSATGDAPLGYTVRLDGTGPTVSSAVVNGKRRLSVTPVASQTPVWAGGAIQTTSGAEFDVAIGGRYKARCKVVIPPTTVPIAPDFFVSEFNGGTVQQRVVALWKMAPGQDVKVTGATAASMLSLDATEGLTLWLETPEIVVRSTSGAPKLGLYWRLALQQGEPTTVTMDISDVSVMYAGSALSALVTTSLDAIIAFKGDSTEAGQPPAGGLNGLQAVQSVSAVFADLLAAESKRVSDDNWFGSRGCWGETAQNIASYLMGDNRLQVSGAWALGSDQIAGGNNFGASAAGTGTYNPRRAVKKVDIYWRDGATGRNFAALFDGTTTQVNSSGSTGSAFVKTTVAATTAALRALALTWNGSGNVSIVCIDMYDDTAGMPIRVYNWGISGATVATHLNATATPRNRLQQYADFGPHVCFIQAGINDARQNVSVATFKSNLTTDVQNQKTARGGTCKVILVTPIHDPSTTGNAPNLEQYAQAMREVAIEQAVSLHDERALWVSHENAVSQGWAVQGDVHDTATGKAQRAAWRRQRVAFA